MPTLLALNKGPLTGPEFDFQEWIADRFRRYGAIGILAGSAISIWAPSSLPTAIGFRNAILQAILDTTPTLMELKDRFITNVLLNQDLRLEATLEELELIAPGSAEAFLQVLESGEPNALHSALVNLLLTGTAAVIYTTNQDLMLERAAAAQNTGQQSRIDVITPNAPRKRGNASALIKLHGSVDVRGSVRTTFTQVGQLLPAELTESLEWDLSSFPFLVLGYSGNDIDIRPIFRRADLVEVVWCVRSAPAPDVHFGAGLAASGKPVAVVTADLGALQHWNLPRLSDESARGARRAYDLALDVLETVVKAESARCFACARVARLTGHGELRSVLRTRAAQAADLVQWLERWRLPFDRAEQSLFGGLVAGAMRAYVDYRRAYAQATTIGDRVGIFDGLRGMGMALEQAGLGLVSWPYSYALRKYYPRALRILRKLSGLQRLVLWDLIGLRITSAFAHTGRTRIAVRRFRSLVHRSRLSFVRGHALRNLAILLARDGNYHEAHDALRIAQEQFEYLGFEAEIADVLRNRAAVLVLENRTLDALSTARRAETIYLRHGNRRGVLRARLLQRFFRVLLVLPHRMRSSLRRWVLCL